MPLEIAHITIDGKKTDEETPIDEKNLTTTKMSDVIRMFNEKKPMFIKFYANWCGHCKVMEKPWEELIAGVKKNESSKDKNFAIVEIESKKMNTEIDKIISTTKNLGKVDGFPTIGTITYEGADKKPIFTTYDGGRTTKDMLEFVLDKKNKLVSEMGGGARRTRRRKHKHSKHKHSKHSKSAKRRKTKKFQKY